MKQSELFNAMIEYFRSHAELLDERSPNRAALEAGIEQLLGNARQR